MRNENERREGRGEGRRKGLGGKGSKSRQQTGGREKRERERKEKQSTNPLLHAPIVGSPLLSSHLHSSPFPCLSTRASMTNGCHMNYVIQSVPATTSYQYIYIYIILYIYIHMYIHVYTHIRIYPRTNSRFSVADHTKCKDRGTNQVGPHCCGGPQPQPLPQPPERMTMAMAMAMAGYTAGPQLATTGDDRRRRHASRSVAAQAGYRVRGGSIQGRQDREDRTGQDRTGQGTHGTQDTGYRTCTYIHVHTSHSFHGGRCFGLVGCGAKDQAIMGRWLRPSMALGRGSKSLTRDVFFFFF